MQLMRDLIDYLNHHDQLYNKGIPEISDKAYDEAYLNLKNLEETTGLIYPNSPTQKIEYDFVTSLTKVKHNHPMLSLDKTKDWNEFMQYFHDEDVVLMLKMDGLTCSLHYLDGRLVGAETRGNGIEGEDILHNARIVSNIPKHIDYTDELIIDGEIICTKNNFEPFKDTYSNPRNFAAGSIRLLDAKECAQRHLSFIAWNVVKGFDKTNSFLKKLETLSTFGFTIVPWTSGFDWDAKDFLIKQAEELGYPIDGLVAKFDKISYGESLGSTSHHFKAAYAFKLYDELYETHLLDIEWSMGRSGILTPVAIFEPVEIEGAIIERASLHNLSIYKQLFYQPYKGQLLHIYRANMIIPQIFDADKNITVDFPNFINIPDVCPICGKPVAINESESGVENIVCANPLCSGKFINRIDYFAGKKGLDIKGLSKATIEKLIDLGWLNSLKDLFELKSHRTEWMQIEGFGAKSVDNILNAIEAARTVSLEKFICSIGIPLIGSAQSKEIVKHILTWEDFRQKVDSEFDFSQFSLFGPNKCYNILNFDYSEIDSIIPYIIFKESDAKTGKNILDGKTFVITGTVKKFKNRAELSSKIESFGGKVTGAVSKNTSYLINNDKTSTSAKNLTAQKLNIPIISEEDFITMIEGA